MLDFSHTYTYTASFPGPKMRPGNEARVVDATYLVLTGSGGLLTTEVLVKL